MRIGGWWIIVGVMATGMGVASAQGAAQSWELRDGRWQQVSSPTTQQVVSEPELDQAEEMLGRHVSKPALKVLVRWLKDHKESAQRDRGLYLLAEGYYQEDDWIVAFYHLDELMDNYPDSRLFYLALQKQYDIADGFLKGHKRKFLGMAVLSMDEEAVEMLYRIQQRSPGSPLAERALLRTADWYYADAQYEVAADAYAAYAKNYPRSPVIQTVRLRQAFSSYAQFRGVKFDPTAMIDARAQLVDLIAAYPEMARQENLASFIERIDATFARKLFWVADYYRRTGEPRAAAYYLQYLMRTYPTTPEAKSAQGELARLPESALTPTPLKPTTTAPAAAPMGK